MSFILEVCVDSVESAMEAVKGGANRLELCSALIIGGTTPNINLFELIKEKTNIKVNILIRPRYGDFCYTEDEFEIMKRDIQMFKKAGASGVVIGILKPDGTLDIDRMKELIEVAEGMHITLNRAFDVCINPFTTLEEAKKLGISSILTSGQKNKCTEGRELLKELVEKSEDKIEILIGSGINSGNVEDVIRYTKSYAVHTSGKMEIESNMKYRKEDISMGFPILSEYIILRTQSEEIAKVREILEKF
ncbi:copper homeostasis protein CutC [Clostridium tagluense]|uniref:copper homeostasis protein CutC n=1 Tax=Clostridium tagluense TaxID=360422 RepID=UPI001C0AB5AE|nr:copper homeostasis protein CutC [Clostridium tagluense]MBU3129238.1 copper homeostasis protein CutC [Clostridium tagluense]MCB2310273.1 copper homeostasis protein CutC [Clostridium tagluense]MCB2315085.1 copper homeostasis protein CutC [Clostridium tagluense]MCB2319973.1 copper homeostasis protein CutC [Clostridium tagluense]MCB2324828.1 copper homeostasis protein CutC [Clostridium tagluense]